MTATFVALCAASSAVHKSQLEIEDLFGSVESARSHGMQISAELRRNVETCLAKFCQALRDYERLKRSYFASQEAKKAFLTTPGRIADRTSTGELLASLG